MPGEITCDNCGGDDFFKEAGAYFCSECQVQSQEVREIVFDQTFVDSQPQPSGATKRIQSEQKAKNKDLDKVTTWEVYNYILLGLTEELIKLGAKPCLKPVVRIVWLKYLEKMEVFNRNTNALPKLQHDSKIDAEVIYGKQTPKKTQKRKRTSSLASSVDTSKLSGSTVKKMRAYRQGALIKAQYELSQKSSDGASLHSEATSLTSLKSSRSAKLPKITFNIYATRRLKSLMSKEHLREHKMDHAGELDCHKFTMRANKHFYESPASLRPQKLYVFLCIGLAIIGDDIQVGDVLRFIDGGHLSFSYYFHLLPEHFNNKALSIQLSESPRMQNNNLRLRVAQMAGFLKLQKYIAQPNLVKLCQRYCAELNLPHEIFLCCKKIITESRPKLCIKSFGSHFISSPEARALSIIVVVLKLFFGLDDLTETKFGDYTNILNSSQFAQPKFFNIMNWLKFIAYRNVVMEQHHFPTQFFSKYGYKMENPDLFLGFLSGVDRRRTEDCEDKFKFLQVLNHLKSFAPVREAISLPHSKTPFKDYVQQLKHTFPADHNTELLLTNFENDSIVHITRPVKFLEILKKTRQIPIVHGGANNNWSVVDYDFGKASLIQDHCERRKLITVKVRKRPVLKRAEVKSSRSSLGLQKSFATSNKTKFYQMDKFVKYRKGVASYDLKKMAAELAQNPQRYFAHYNPFERYWMLGVFVLRKWTSSLVAEVLDKSPSNFRLIINECLRIAQCQAHDFLPEFVLTETYLCHEFKEQLKLFKPQRVKKRRARKQKVKKSAEKPKVTVEVKANRWSCESKIIEPYLKNIRKYW